MCGFVPETGKISIYYTLKMIARISGLRRISPHQSDVYLNELTHKNNTAVL
jgi:hypothetical protein